MSEGTRWPGTPFLLWNSLKGRRLPFQQLSLSVCLLLVWHLVYNSVASCAVPLKESVPQHPMRLPRCLCCLLQRWGNSAVA
eukprot:1161798-Pelagomonas_calceolata.AAC.6